MQVAQGLPWLAPLVAGVGLCLVTAAGAAAGWHDARPVRVITSAPRASLAAPVPTPAVYRGRLFAKNARATPRGTRGSVVWWWVGRTYRGKSRTACSKLESGDLVLKEGTHQAFVDMFDDLRGPALVADGRSEPLRPLTIDLGPIPLHEGDIPPAAPCQSSEYQERVLADGAEVEILGCHSDGELRRCPGELSGVLGVPSVAKHAFRRSQQARPVARVAAALGMLSLIGLSLWARRLTAQRLSIELRQELDA